ncbi:hypothetical protein E8E13_008490 [Curvularia kusanoi]|uniref:Uncharacterized protein n=1 Tax=Curvularia kusanoi TaxID=90978 RepID=A0A9P4WD93_CURKU|nr:hypothetical protein E8E13_008490 [Curvularia kusanoi]
MASISHEASLYLQEPALTFDTNNTTNDCHLVLTMASMSGGQTGQTKTAPQGRRVEALLAGRGEILKAIDAKGERLTFEKLGMMPIEAVVALRSYPMLFREFLDQEDLFRKVLRLDEDPLLYDLNGRKAKPRADAESKPELKLEPKPKPHMDEYERFVRRPLETRKETVSGPRKKRKVASEQTKRGQTGAATPAMPSMSNLPETIHKAQPDLRGRGRGDRGVRVTPRFRSRGRGFGPDISSAPQPGGTNREGFVFSSTSRQGSTLQQQEQADATSIDEGKLTPASRAEIIQLQKQLETVKAKIRDGDQQLLLMNENIELRRQLTASQQELRESRRELKAVREQLSLRSGMALGTSATETGQVKVEEDE